MANLIAGREVAKELIQKDFSPLKVADEALRLLDDATLRDKQKAELRGVRKALGPAGASARAAEVVAELID
jgi:lipid-A-disaccharide synthase